MKKLFGFIALSLLLSSAMAHDNRKAHPFHHKYTVHSIEGDLIVLNGASVPAEYTAVLGDKTVIEISGKMHDRTPLAGPINRGFKASPPCVKAWLATNLPAGTEVTPLIENWRTENANMDKLGSVHGPKFWGDLSIKGTSVRASIIAAQRSCTEL